MEVTASNFQDVLPSVEKAIDNCTFMSIDCEFTGLNVTHKTSAFDTPKQYYEKVRQNCKDFLVIQYGLSTFRYNAENNKFDQSTYNFYIFRRPINRNVPDQRFLCQTSSIDFLISNDFDFNKLFKSGIPYLNQEEHEKYRSNLEEGYQRRIDGVQENGYNDTIPIPDNAREFIDEIVEKIDAFLETDQPELELPKCNSFLRKLIYQTRQEKYPKRISLETRQINKDRVLFVTRLKTSNEIKEIEKKKYEEQFKELDNFEGFTKVLKLMSKSNKLIIGHNLCLDFLHSIDKFLTPLPEDYQEFKDMAHSLFPKVLDTKYMSSIEPFKPLITSSILKQLLDKVSEEPFQIPTVEIQAGAQGYDKFDEKEHEAGYDAFITGLSFLAMWKYLGTSEMMEDRDIFGSLDLLEPYINKIFLMISENQYFNLAGEDLNPSRDHMFYLTFPREWKHSNITQLFSPFGNVFVSWLDDTSAYVGLYQKDQAAVALSTLSQSDTYSIMTYARRQAILAGISTPLPSPWVNRKRKSTEAPPSVKKRRTNSLNSGSFSSSKRSIDPIEEEQLELEDSIELQTSEKTFAEDDSWE